MPKAKPGFTLLELMVVVAVVAILAGIAMQNYGLAQIRAKVARTKADMNTLATAIEAYAVDHNAYPRMAHWKFYSDPAYDIVKESRVQGILSRVLSTPVAYVPVAPVPDPFMAHASMAPVDEQQMTYQVIPEYVRNNPRSQFWPAAEAYYGRWRLGSVGPDLRFDHAFANSAQLDYDPTNGSISPGNIWRGERGVAEQCPPVPALLGEH
jgi:prepilin-type N-terminal cleavage/methylation domain-containing protein